jgi:hypothetical protein
MPVLRQLLRVAAAAPRQQLPVLLQAAAEAGNMQTWLLLLQLQAADDGQQQQDQDQEGLPPLDWSCLSLQHITQVLQLLLPSSDVPHRDSQMHLGTSQQQQWQAAEDTARLQMADLLWQVLVVQQGREAALRQHIQSAPAQQQEDGEPVSSMWAGPGCFWRQAASCTLLWLVQHDLLPCLDSSVAVAGEMLRMAMQSAAGVGDFAHVLQLYHATAVLPEAHKRSSSEEPFSWKVLLADVFRGHLHRACAAGDAAAVAQLERLTCFAENVFRVKEVSNHSCCICSF